MQNEKVLHIALVGCGGMARHYRKKYTQIPGAALKLVVDIDPDTAKKAADELGIEQWSTDYKDALSPDIDMVDISTPNFLHAEQAIQAFNAGKHVLLQKPIAPTVEEARAIVKAASLSEKKAGMYMSLFDNPLYYDLKRIVDEGLLGKISNIFCRGANKNGLAATPHTWRSSLDKTGGGALIQLTIHPLNMVQWLIGKRVVSVAAFSKNLMCPNIEGDDSTAAACEFEDGITGALEASYSSNLNVLAIYGSKGFINVQNHHTLQLQLDERFQGNVIEYVRPGEMVTEQYPIPVDNPCDQHVAFVKAVLEDTAVQMHVESALHDLLVVKAIYKSSQEKRFVDIIEM